MLACSVKARTVTPRRRARVMKLYRRRLEKRCHPKNWVWQCSSASIGGVVSATCDKWKPHFIDAGACRCFPLRNRTSSTACFRLLFEPVLQHERCRRILPGYFFFRSIRSSIYTPRKRLSLSPTPSLPGNLQPCCTLS